MDERYEQTFLEYNSLYRLSNEIYHEVAVKLGLSDSAFDVLYFLRERGDGCLQKDICQASCLPKQTVNTSLQKMVRQGLVRLESDHGRGTRVHATEAGRAALEQLIDPVMEAERESFYTMTPDECAVMMRLTRQYLKELKQRTDALPYPEEQS